MTALAEFLFSLSTCGVVGLVGLLFVADYGEHESYGVVDTLDIYVGARGVGAGDNRIGPEAVVICGLGNFGSRECRRDGRCCRGPGGVSVAVW